MAHSRCIPTQSRRRRSCTACTTCSRRSAERRLRPRRRARGKVKLAVEPLFALMGKGEQPASAAIAAMADLDLAHKVGDQLGKMPDAILAQTLGAILKRADFGPDPARVEIVLAIGKIQA